MSGVAGTFFLLLHLHVELLHVHGVSVFAADEFGEVERETVGVEQSEGLCAVELGQLVCLQLVHGSVEQVDAVGECAQEGVFLFLHHAADELLLGLQLGEGVAHLLHQYGQQLVEKCLFLVEERVGVAHSTAQNAADDVAGLSVGRQLAVGDGERHSTQVVGTDAHGDVDVLLLLALCPLLLLFLKGGVFETGDLLLHLDDGLEDVGVVVGVFALQHAHEALEAHTGVDDVHGELLQ